MKIASLETGIVLLPNDEPLAGFSENPNAKNPIVTLRLRTYHNDATGALTTPIALNTAAAFAVSRRVS